MASDSWLEALRPPGLSSSCGIGPMAMTKNPYEATSERKLTCSHGELAHAPLPQAIMGNLFFPPKGTRFPGRNTVCVRSELSWIISALYGPDPPSSTILE